MVILLKFIKLKLEIPMNKLHKISYQTSVLVLCKKTSSLYESLPRVQRFIKYVYLNKYIWPVITVPMPCIQHVTSQDKYKWISFILECSSLLPLQKCTESVCNSFVSKHVGSDLSEVEETHAQDGVWLGSLGLE